MPLVDMPPRELLEFVEADWAPFAPAEHPRVRCEGPERDRQLAIEAWCDVREKWRDAHGWPTDAVDFIREEVAARTPGFYDRK